MKIQPMTLKAMIIQQEDFLMDLIMMKLMN